MKPSVVVVFLLLCAGVFGCATGRATPPPAQPLELGPYRATYRVYVPSAADLCQQDGRRVRDELEQVNGVLAEFLGATSAGEDGMWAEEQLALLNQAPQVLPAALAAHDATLSKLPQCRFAPQLGLEQTVHRGREFSAQAQRRLAEAPSLRAYVMARRAVEAWRSELSQREAAAKKANCRGRPGTSVYLASLDETGTKRWLFCDGHTVQATRGEAPVLLPASPKKKARLPKAKPYLDAAARYPDSDLHRAPPLPERSHPPAESKDTLDLNSTGEP